MSSRPSHRPAITALVVLALLALAAPPVHATQAPSLLGHLGAQIQTWLAGVLPGGRIDNQSATPTGGHAALSSHGRPVGGEGSGKAAAIRQGRAVHPIIRPQCDTNPSSDPNGCPSH